MLEVHIYIYNKINCSDSIESTIYILKSFDADFYIYNVQGEYALGKLVDAIINNKDWTNIDNIVYKNKEEYIFNNSYLESNLLENNIVNWELFKGRVGKFAMTRTSISCPFSCSFCAFPMHSGKYTTMNIEDIEYEFNKIEELGEVKSIQILDDTMNVPKDRFKDMLPMMIRNKYSFKWNADFRCQYADEETVKLMKESGCEGVLLGIESGNQTILDNMNKKADINDFRKGIRIVMA